MSANQPTGDRWRRLPGRLAEAYRKGGLVAVLFDIRKMSLFRLHFWILDALPRRAEPQPVARTTALDELAIDSANKPHGVQYEPTPFSLFRWSQQAMAIEPKERTFVDAGSGRGRVVAAAMRVAYAEVIGVEFSRELCRQAEALVAAVPEASRRAGRTRLVCRDILDFELPDGPCVIYMFNPFDASVMAKFRDRIAKSWLRNPRPIRLVYLNPVHADIFESDRRFETVPLPWSVRWKLVFSPYRLMMFRLAGQASPKNIAARAI